MVYICVSLRRMVWYMINIKSLLVKPLPVSLEGKIKNNHIAAQILTAWRLIADPENNWCRFLLAANSYGELTAISSSAAVKFCAIGAIRRIEVSSRSCQDLLLNVSKKLYQSGLNDINDYCGHHIVRRVYRVGILVALYGWDIINDALSDTDIRKQLECSW